MPGVVSAGEIARCVGVSTAEVEHWLALGLLGPVDHGELTLDGLERARLLAWARRRGIDADAIADVCAREGDVLEPFVTIIPAPRPPGVDLREACRRSGLDETLARRVWIARGMSPDDELFDDDVLALSGIRSALDAGLPEDALLQLARVLGDALGRVADAEVRLFHFYVHEPLREKHPDRGEERRATAAATVALRALTEPSILYAHHKAFERAMREDLFLHLVEDAAPPGATAQLRAAVLFVDLARYTPLTEAMGDAAVVTVLDRFSDLVREIATARDGRIVKQIGDEFMLVFPNAATMVDCALGIAGAVATESHFPAVRMGGHAGPVLFREADFLGQTVNIAARVAGTAGAGELVVTGDVRDAVGPMPDAWQPLGEHQLKGLSGPVALFRVPTPAPTARDTDPVCGMELLLTRGALDEEWAGSRFRFCSTGCRDLFREAPDRYVET